jgi:hypothetical protein
MMNTEAMAEAVAIRVDRPVWRSMVGAAYVAGDGWDWQVEHDGVVFCVVNLRTGDYYEVETVAEVVTLTGAR